MLKYIDNIRSKPAGGIILLFVSIQIVAIIGGLLYPDNFRYQKEKKKKKKKKKRAKA